MIHVSNDTETMFDSDKRNLDWNVQQGVASYAKDVTSKVFKAEEETQKTDKDYLCHRLLSHLIPAVGRKFATNRLLIQVKVYDIQL